MATVALRLKTPYFLSAQSTWSFAWVRASRICVSSMRSILLRKVLPVGTLFGTPHRIDRSANPLSAYFSPRDSWRRHWLMSLLV